MRLDPHGFRPEPVAGAAKATNNLIRDDQYVVFVTNPLDFRPVCAWRNNDAAGTLNRLAAFNPPVRLVDVVNAGDRHAALCVHIAHAAKRPGSNRRPVIGILTADNVGFLGLSLHVPIGADHANVCIVRFGP